MQQQIVKETGLYSTLNNELDSQPLFIKRMITIATLMYHDM